jgi:hypothetical protein
LKNHVAHPHPNIFYLINLLKEQQASTEIKLIQYSAGGKCVPRKGKYVEIDNRLVNLKSRLRNILITPVNYAVAYPGQNCRSSNQGFDVIVVLVVDLLSRILSLFPYTLGVMEKATLGGYTWEDAVCSVADCNLII